MQFIHFWNGCCEEFHADTLMLKNEHFDTGERSIFGQTATEINLNILQLTT